MREKKALLAVVFVLASALVLAAEVALDEVVQAGRFVLYRDQADPHKYFYVPDAPRLAVKRDGTPEFTFIKYTKTDGATKGGIIHFLVTWGMTEGELSSAESALRLKDPEAKIAGPVPFKEGTFKVVSATAGEGGLFSRRIVGEGKAPIMPGQKAAVSIALTEEGASLLWESFKNPTSDISVMFDLKFTGLSPAFQAKLKVNWDKVYTQHDIKLHAEGQIKVVKIEADVRAILEELRQKGAIELEVVGENENMQKMLDTVYAHLLSLMCEKVPMGPGEGATPPAKKRPVPAAVADWPGGHPAYSMGVLADVVRSADGRLRGGPFFDQEQIQAQSAAASPCDEPSRQKAEALVKRALSFLNSRDYVQAVQMYEQAFQACPDPIHLYKIAQLYALYCQTEEALRYYADFLQKAASWPQYADEKTEAGQYPRDVEECRKRRDWGCQLFDEKKYIQAADEFRWCYDFTGNPYDLWNLGLCYLYQGDLAGNREDYQKAVECFEGVINIQRSFPEYGQDPSNINEAQQALEQAKSSLASGQAAAGRPESFRSRNATRTGTSAGQSQVSQQTEQDARRQRRQDAQTQQQAQTATAGQQAASTGQGTKPPAGQSQTSTASGQETKPPGTQTGASNTAGGQGQAGSSGQSQTGGNPPAGQRRPPNPPAKPQAPGRKPQAPGAPGAPAIKPIVSVQLGYSFRRIKMSGNYEVDMRKRLHEDRDIVMSGNIGGIYQQYGEDKRFFTVVSLDDPTFQERSVEVILDGQDASDFKSYINSVSVLFRKERFSGAPMTGEVKFIDQQFAQSGNHLSFKYGRLNEASTEWLDYEYKPKWSFYGGVEWEGDWTKTSDSVLTLSPPVRRRTLEISVDEANILKNNVKALALQIKHQIYGKDILKEVIINYDKGDPLQANYTYLHEDGHLGYSYKVVWLLLDGREVHTDWMSKESPFIYAVYTKK
jgi:tetratricopeptide (TPR) repeat protein